MTCENTRNQLRLAGERKCEDR